MFVRKCNMFQLMVMILRILLFLPVYLKVLALHRRCSSSTLMILLMLLNGTEYLYLQMICKFSSSPNLAMTAILFSWSWGGLKYSISYPIPAVTQYFEMSGSFILSQENYFFPYHLGISALARVDQARDLGIIMDQKLHSTPIA